MAQNNKELIQLRSAKLGTVRCPLKGVIAYGSVGHEIIYKCVTCEFQRGLFELPRTIAVACAKEYPAWETQTTSIFTVAMLKLVPQLTLKGKIE